MGTDWVFTARTAQQSVQVCVLLILYSTHLHPAQPVSEPMPTIIERRTLWSQSTRQRCTLQIRQGDLAVQRTALWTRAKRLCKPVHHGLFSTRREKTEKIKRCKSVIKQWKTDGTLEPRYLEPPKNLFILISSILKKNGFQVAKAFVWGHEDLWLYLVRAIMTYEGMFQYSPIRTADAIAIAIVGTEGHAS